MIKCQNCGAEFDENKLNCPFCGYENVKVAQEAYHKEIDKIVEEREQIHTLPEKITRKRTITFVKIALVVILLAFAGIGIRYKYQQMELEYQVETEQYHKECMEKFLAAGDYKSLYDYYDAKLSDEYNRAYDRYVQLYDMYDDYMWMQECMSFHNEYITSEADRKGLYISWIIEDAKEIQDYAKELINDNERLGNEKHLEALLEIIRNDTCAFLEIDEARLDEILAMEVDEDSEYPYGEVAEEIAKAKAK